MTSPDAILDHFKITDQVLRDAVAAALHRYGVPTDLDQVDQLVTALLMTIVEQRRYLHARQLEIINASESLPTAPPVRYYPRKSLHTITRQAVGLTPQPRRAQIEIYDPRTQRMETRAVAPWTAPDEPEMVDEVQRRLTATTGQHARSAARQTVTDAAGLTRARWARRLTGAENCAFCALLASRGAVYAEQHALFESHPHCDCYAVLVTGGDDWAGKDEADEIARLWRSSSGMGEFRQKFREKYGAGDMLDRYTLGEITA